jgi:hypothetical protein
MVVFQRKIIYMGYIPPGARTEVSTLARCLGYSADTYAFLL